MKKEEKASISIMKIICISIILILISGIGVLAMNTKLDPELLNSAIIITNQNGFDIMDNWKDAVGKPILQDHPTEKTKKTLGGVTIEVFANRTIKDVDGASPVYIGNLEEAVKFMDREQLAIAVSTEAGFTKNNE